MKRKKAIRTISNYLVYFCNNKLAGELGRILGLSIFSLVMLPVLIADTLKIGGWKEGSPGLVPKPDTIRNIFIVAFYPVIIFLLAVLFII